MAKKDKKIVFASENKPNYSSTEFIKGVEEVLAENDKMKQMSRVDASKLHLRFII